MKLLVIEDDLDVANMVKSGLQSDCHIVEVANDGAEGSFLARSYEYDAIILDYSLPKKDGLAVCTEIRKNGRSTPIIFLSVTDDVPIKIAAFNSGADDYMTKPFSMDELRARIKAISKRPAKFKNSMLTVSDLVMNIDTQTVCRSNELIRFTRKELGLLEYFMRNAGVILSRATIMEHVWSVESDPFSNTVEVHVRNLRKKLNSGNRPDLIANITGRGYIIDSPENLKKMLVA